MTNKESDEIFIDLCDKQRVYPHRCSNPKTGRKFIKILIADTSEPGSGEAGSMAMLAEALFRRAAMQSAYCCALEEKDHDNTAT